MTHPFFRRGITHLRHRDTGATYEIVTFQPDSDGTVIGRNGHGQFVVLVASSLLNFDQVRSYPDPPSEVWVEIGQHGEHLLPDDGIIGMTTERPKPGFRASMAHRYVLAESIELEADS